MKVGQKKSSFLMTPLFFTTQPKVVTDTDEAELTKEMERLALENQEVGGDESGSEEDDDDEDEDEEEEPATTNNE